MEYVQERVTTLHALTDHRPDAPTGRAAVVVPMTEREYGTLAADRVLTALESVDPARVVVPSVPRASASAPSPTGSTASTWTWSPSGVAARGSRSCSRLADSTGTAERVETCGSGSAAP